ncbi:hypothetical protein [Escherichia coli]|uniref:hypothetical protein n=1 Tax=Escherichia coli TaxID=562 RepID=UPI000B12D811|nr:hypothetical protein [Escherichia coli]
MRGDYKRVKESYSGIKPGRNSLTPSFKSIYCRSRLWSDNDIDILRSLFFRGVPCKDIAFVLGRSSGAVFSKCRKIGLFRYRRYTAYEDSVIRKYAGKKSASEISSLINRSYSSVLKRCFIKRILLRRYGDNNPFSKLSDNDVSLIIELRNQGLSFTEIADKFDCSARYVSELYYGRRCSASDYYHFAELKKSGVGLS